MEQESVNPVKSHSIFDSVLYLFSRYSILPPTDRDWLSILGATPGIVRSDLSPTASGFKASRL